MRLTFMHNRIAEIKNIQRHRKEVQRIAKEKGYSFPFHDFLKMINGLVRRLWKLESQEMQ